MPTEGCLDILPANEIRFHRECRASLLGARSLHAGAFKAARGAIRGASPAPARMSRCNARWSDAFHAAVRARPGRPPRPAPGAPAVLVGQTLEKSLILKNYSDCAVAFKFQTTAPKRYFVHPNSSVIKAHEWMQVRIGMWVGTPARAFSRATARLCDCRAFTHVLYEGRILYEGRLSSAREPPPPGALLPPNPQPLLLPNPQGGR